MGKAKPANLTSSQPLVHTIAPPDFVEEQEYAHAQVAQPQNVGSTGIPGIMDDAAVQANLDKKRVFERLILFREEHTTEVELGGLKFRLKLLNANENSYVLKQMRQVPPDEQVSKLALMVLAAAIIDVNGVRFEDTYSGPEDLEDPVLRRYYELNLWSSPVANALSAAYHQFQLSFEKELTRGFLAK